MRYSVVATNVASFTPGVLSATASITLAIDPDGDDIPDVYETANGLNPNDAADALLFADADPPNNLEEYIAGTDLKDPASFLMIDRISRGTKTAVEFTGLRGKSYSVQYTDNLSGGACLKLSNIVPLADGPQSVADPTPNPKRVYREATPLQPQW